MAAVDQLFKEALHEFFPEFVELFFPQIAAQIDFGRGIVFRDRELFTDFPDGAQREPDVVAEVAAVTGEPELILMHTEVQGKRQAEFPFRMWEYYALLRLRTALPVFPIVIYLAPGAGSSRWEDYSETLLGERLLHFRYSVISLPELSADEWRALPGPAGALAAALSAIMRPGRTSPARLKFDGLARAATSNINDAKKTILTTILETYLPLSNPSDTAEFAQLISSDPFGEEITAMVSPYELRGIEQGKQQGLQQGMQQGLQQGVQEGLLIGQRQMLLHVLRTRFGELPEPVVLRVNAQVDSEALTAALDKALSAQSLEETGI